MIGNYIVMFLAGAVLGATLANVLWMVNHPRRK